MNRSGVKKITRTIGAAALASMLVAAMRAPVLGAAGPSLPSAGITRNAMTAGRDAHPAMRLARAHDDGESAANPKGKKHHRDANDGNYGGPFFRPADAGYFHQCYGGGDVKSLPPGLQKNARTGHLPPGLEKHLERTGHLPPGLEKRISPVSPCVLGHLGPLPPHSRLYLLGRDAYLINYHTREIIDILRGAY